MAWTSPTGQNLVTEPWSADPDPYPDPYPESGRGWPDAPGRFNEHPADHPGDDLGDDLGDHPGDPPARPEPDWLGVDGLPTDAEIDAQLARYDTHPEFDCVVDESDSEAA